MLIFTVTMWPTNNYTVYQVHRNKPTKANYPIQSVTIKLMDCKS